MSNLAWMKNEILLATIKSNKLELIFKSNCLGKYLLSLICNEVEIEYKIKSFI